MKRKGSNLLIPAKLHASIKNTNSERIKSTMQNIHLENKALKSKTEQIKFEFENKSKYGIISGLYFPVFGLNTEI